MHNFTRIRKIHKQGPPKYFLGGLVNNIINGGNPHTIGSTLGKPTRDTVTLKNGESENIALARETAEWRKGLTRLQQMDTSKMGEFVNKWAGSSLSNVMGGMVNAASSMANQFLTTGIDNKGVNIAMGFTQNIPVIGSALSSLIGGGYKLADVFAKNSRTFGMDQNIRALAGASYGGAWDEIEDAAALSGKKRILGKRRRSDNQKMNAAEDLMYRIGNVVNLAKDLRDIAANMHDINSVAYQQELAGGLDARYFQVAKLGAKLERIKKINFNKLGGTIKDQINLDEWEPTITEPIVIQEWEPIITFKEGGKTEEIKDSEIEETSLKNVIPEGALHAHKHHMENDENITKKGIPVIGNDGEQQAEVEKEEIILILEVTKKLEELKEKFEETKDDLYAIEAGKLLVDQILNNTDDRTGLIKRCKEGGKL